MQRPDPTSLPYVRPVGARMSDIKKWDARGCLQDAECREACATFFRLRNQRQIALLLHADVLHDILYYGKTVVGVGVKGRVAA